MRPQAYLDSMYRPKVFGWSSLRYVFFGVQVSQYLKKKEKDEAYLDSTD
jgi:hypothetical protein